MTLILLLVGSYILGNVLTGSIISNFFFKKDIRIEGSGNPGARNAGRVFGKKAFIATFIGDALKGALAIFVAKWLGFGVAVELCALFAVTLGHVYPLFLKFPRRDGRIHFHRRHACIQSTIICCFCGLVHHVLSVPKKLHVSRVKCSSIDAGFSTSIFIRNSCIHRSLFVISTSVIYASR